MWDIPFSIPLCFYLSLYFCSTKRMESLTLNRHNSFHYKNNRKATHAFASRPLLFKLQQEVWKFSDICLSWSSPKNDLETNFLNLKSKFWVCHFLFSILDFLYLVTIEYYWLHMIHKYGLWRQSNYSWLFCDTSKGQ